MADGGNVIDRLEIEIEASAKGVGHVLDGLESDLKRLKAVMSSIDTKALTNIQKAVNQTNNTSASPKVDTTSMSKAERDVSNSINKLKQSLAGLEAYKNAALSGDTSSMTSFERRVISIQSSINVLGEKLRGLGDTRVNSGAFITVENKIDETRAKLETLKAKMNDAISGKTSMSNNEFRQLNEQIVNTRGELDKLIERQKAMLNDGTAYTDPFQGYREGLLGVQDALNRVSAEVERFKASQPIDDGGGASRLASALESVSSAAVKASQKLLSLVGSGIKVGFSAVTSAVSKLKSGISNLSTATDKGFNKGFKTILKYGFGIRSTYVLFKRLKTAVKDSFTELQKSGAFYQTTKANLDGLKASLSTLKYQFGAAFEPIFNTVAPALQTLINYLVSVMNTLSAFIAKLTGKSTYSKAVASTAAIASNTGSAASSAKEMNKQLQGFDELNNLSGDTGSGSGGGGGSSSDASNVHYVEESVESALGSFMSSIAEDIENGDWESVGSKISSKLTSVLNDIDWDSTFSTVNTFGTNLANFFNGLITDDLFSSLGSTVGNAINVALSGLNSFGTTFDWSNFGSSIGSGINSFVSTHPLSLATETFNTWANGILTTIIEAVGKIKWGDVAQAIADAVETLDFTGISINLAKAANAIATALYTLVSKKKTWENLGTKMGEGISKFFAEADFSMYGATIHDALSGLLDAGISLLENTDFETIGNKLGDFLNSLKVKDLKSKVLTLCKNIISAIGDTISGFKEDATERSKLETAIGALLGVLAITKSVPVTLTFATTIAGYSLGQSYYEWQTGTTVNQSFISQLEDIWDGLFKDRPISFNVFGAIKFVWDELTGKHDGTTEDANIKTGLTTFITTLLNPYAGMTLVWLDIGEYIKIKWVDLHTSLFEWGEKFVDALSTLKTTISSAWQSVWYGNGTGVAHGYNGAPSDAVAYIESQQTSDLDEAGANLWNGIYNGFEKAMKYTNPLLTPILWLKDKILSWWSDTFEEHSPAKAMYPLGENLWRGIYEGFKQAMSDYSLSDLITDVKNVLLGDDEEETVATGTHSKRAETISEEGKTKLKNGTLQLNIKTKLTGEATSKKEVEDLSTAFNGLTTESGKSTSATYEAETGGELTSANDIDSWRTKFSRMHGTWQGKSATMSVTTGGQISSINDLSGTDGKSGWAKKYLGVYNVWNSPEEAIFKATTGGQITSINDLSGTDGKGGWLKRFNILHDGWKDANATFKAESNTTDVDNSLKKGGSYYNAVVNWKKTTTATFNTSADGSVDMTTLNNSRSSWRKTTIATFRTNANGKVDLTDLNNSKKNWSGTTTANFNTKADGNLSNQKWADINNSISTWNGKTATATFDTYVDASAVTNAMNDPNSAINQAYYKWPTWGNTATMYMNFSGDTTGLDTFINNVKSKLNQLTVDIRNSGGQVSTDGRRAKGGIYSNGSWKNLPQYAGGTLNAGSMFIAGEKGPELIGNINGRTEILNKSQIASTVNRAIVSGMMRFRSMQLRTPESIASDTITTSSYNGNTFSKDYEDAINEQNRLIAEQNELLRRIADKDVSISSRDVFNAVKGEANSYYRRKGNSPFLF